MNKARTAAVAAQNRRSDLVIGSIVREMESVDDAHVMRAGQLLRSAIMNMAGVSFLSPGVMAHHLNNAAEYLRLASLEMNRKVGWEG